MASRVARSPEENRPLSRKPRMPHTAPVRPVRRRKAARAVGAKQLTAGARPSYRGACSGRRDCPAGRYPPGSHGSGGQAEATRCGGTALVRIGLNLGHAPGIGEEPHRLPGVKPTANLRYRMVSPTSYRPFALRDGSATPEHLTNWMIWISAAAEPERRGECASDTRCRRLYPEL